MPPRLLKLLLALAFFKAQHVYAAGCPDVANALAVHNAYRAQHQAPPLVWNDTIAASAQAWATSLASQGCLMKHSGTAGVGENLAGIWGSVAPRYNCSWATDQWYSEVQYYNFDSPGNSTGVTGHFTQVVWKATTQVGCGAANGTDSGTPCQIQVCQYAPPGNMIWFSPDTYYQYKINVRPAAAANSSSSYVSPPSPASTGRPPSPPPPSPSSSTTKPSPPSPASNKPRPPSPRPPRPSPPSPRSPRPRPSPPSPRPPRPSPRPPRPSRPSPPSPRPPRPPPPNKKPRPPSPSPPVRPPAQKPPTPSPRPPRPPRPSPRPPRPPPPTSVRPSPPVPLPSPRSSPSPMTGGVPPPSPMTGGVPPPSPMTSSVPPPSSSPRPRPPSPAPLRSPPPTSTKSPPYTTAGSPPPSSPPSPTAKVPPPPFDPHNVSGNVTVDPSAASLWFKINWTVLAYYSPSSDLDIVVDWDVPGEGHFELSFSSCSYLGDVLGYSTVRGGIYTGESRDHQVQYELSYFPLAVTPDPSKYDVCARWNVGGPTYNVSLMITRDGGQLAVNEWLVVDSGQYILYEPYCNSSAYSYLGTYDFATNTFVKRAPYPPPPSPPSPRPPKPPPPPPLPTPTLKFKLEWNEQGLWSSSSPSPSAGGNGRRRRAQQTASKCPDVKATLDRHNEYRSLHNAPNLTWSETQAASAQAWAEELAGKGCTLEHSRAGQNLFVKWDGNPLTSTCEYGTLTWYLQEEPCYNYTSGGNTCSSGTVNHFTQVVWKSTTEVGCGAATGILNNAANGPQCFVTVCHYNPYGNVAGYYLDNVKAPNCKKPTTWCTHLGATLAAADCDGDGRTDYTCTDEGGFRGVMLSSDGCSRLWPQAPPSECPAVFGDIEYYDADIVVGWNFNGTYQEITFDSPAVRGGLYGGDATTQLVEEVYWPAGVFPDAATYHVCARWFDIKWDYPDLDYKLTVSLGGQTVSTASLSWPIELQHNFSRCSPAAPGYIGSYNYTPPAGTTPRPPSPAPPALTGPVYPYSATETLKLRADWVALDPGATPGALYDFDIWVQWFRFGKTYISTYGTGTVHGSKWLYDNMDMEVNYEVVVWNGTRPDNPFKYHICAWYMGKEIKGASFNLTAYVYRNGSNLIQSWSRVWKDSDFGPLVSTSICSPKAAGYIGTYISRPASAPSIGGGAAAAKVASVVPESRELDMSEPLQIPVRVAKDDGDVTAAGLVQLPGSTSKADSATGAGVVVQAQQPSTEPGSSTTNTGGSSGVATGVPQAAPAPSDADQQPLDTDHQSTGKQQQQQASSLSSAATVGVAVACSVVGGAVLAALAVVGVRKLRARAKVQAAETTS